MCGITGIFSPNGGLSEGALLPLREALAHRGPDGGSTWMNKEGTVAFGHRRLSIIDLSSAANQPMLSPDGKRALVFNGEIYNHAALREMLISLGHTRWQTDHSDTEVILRAYEQWGMPACLNYLRGMFAFALYDADKKALFVARDRAGEKPLYYTTTSQNEVVFASEIKALLKHPRVERAVDEVALHDYLTFLMVPPPRTLFKGIFKLPAAHWTCIEAGKPIVAQKYWDALDAADTYAKTNPLPRTETEWVQHLEPLLRQSVKLRQEAADVPVGVFLSGGIDSSCIATLAAPSVEKGKLNTFAIGPDTSYAAWPDETLFAERVAKQIGSNHTTVRVSEAAMLAALPSYIALQDEPLADPSALPLYLLAQTASQKGKLKVCQGGEGGDELFVGYEDWLKFEKLTRWNAYPLPRFFKTLGYKMLCTLGQGHKFWVEYLRRAGAGEAIFWGGAEAFTTYEKKRLLGPAMQAVQGRSSYETIAPYAATFAQKPITQKHFWNWCSWLELQLRLPEQLLMRADKTTMATGLELRLPLLDHIFIAAVLNTPFALRAPKGNKKHLLKKILEGVLPKEILYRKKQGLGLPLNEWLLNCYGPFAKAELQHFCSTTGYLNWSFVEGLLNQHRGQHIWYLLNLALWHKQYIQQKPIDMPPL